jgi:hypothetical protein
MEITEMDVQKTDENRELTTAELELVAGGVTDEQRIAAAYFGAQYLGGLPLLGLAYLIGERGYLMDTLHG